MDKHKPDVVASVGEIRPMEGLSLALFGRRVNLSEDAVRQAERRGEIFSIVRPERNHVQEYPAFQAWPELQGSVGFAPSSLVQVLHELGAPQIGGSPLFGFFSSRNDLLGDTTPVEVLAGRLTASRTLDLEVLEFLKLSVQRRLAAVLSAAGAYAADLAA